MTAVYVTAGLSVWGIACLFALALCRVAADADRRGDREVQEIRGFEMEAQ